MDDDDKSSQLQSQLYAMRLLGMPVNMAENMLTVERTFREDGAEPSGMERYDRAWQTEELNSSNVDVTPGWRVGLYAREQKAKYKSRRHQPLPPGEEEEGEIFSPSTTPGRSESDKSSRHPVPSYSNDKAGGNLHAGIQPFHHFIHNSPDKDESKKTTGHERRRERLKTARDPPAASTSSAESKSLWNTATYMGFPHAELQKKSDKSRVKSTDRSHKDRKRGSKSISGRAGNSGSNREHNKRSSQSRIMERGGSRHQSRNRADDQRKRRRSNDRERQTPSKTDDYPPGGTSDGRKSLNQPQSKTSIWQQHQKQLQAKYDEWVEKKEQESEWQQQTQQQHQALTEQAEWQELNWKQCQQQDFFPGSMGQEAFPSQAGESSADGYDLDQQMATRADMPQGRGASMQSSQQWPVENAGHFQSAFSEGGQDRQWQSGSWTSSWTQDKQSAQWDQGAESLEARLHNRQGQGAGPSSIATDDLSEVAMDIEDCSGGGSSQFSKRATKLPRLPEEELVPTPEFLNKLIADDMAQLTGIQKKGRETFKKKPQANTSNYSEQKKPGSGFESAIKGKTIGRLNCTICEESFPSKELYSSHCLTSYHLQGLQRSRIENETSALYSIGAGLQANSNNQLQTSAGGVNMGQMSPHSAGSMSQNHDVLKAATHIPGVTENEICGTQYVLPVTGYFCKVCSKFFNVKELAYDIHCRSNKHRTKSLTRMRHDALQEKLQSEKAKRKGLLIRLAINEPSSSDSIKEGNAALDVEVLEAGQTEASRNTQSAPSDLGEQVPAIGTDAVGGSNMELGFGSSQVTGVGVNQNQELLKTLLPDRPRDKRLTEELIKEEVMIRTASHLQQGDRMTILQRLGQEILEEQLKTRRAVQEEEQKRQERERQIQKRLEEEKKKSEEKAREMRLLEARMQEEQLKIDQLRQEEMQREQLKERELQREQLKERELQREALLQQKLLQERLLAEQLEQQRLQEEKLRQEIVLREQLRAEEIIINEQLMKRQKRQEEAVRARQVEEEIMRARQREEERLLEEQLREEVAREELRILQMEEQKAIDARIAVEKTAKEQARAMRQLSSNHSSENRSRHRGPRKRRIRATDIVRNADSRRRDNQRRDSLPTDGSSRTQSQSSSRTQSQSSRGRGRDSRDSRSRESSRSHDTNSASQRSLPHRLSSSSKKSPAKTTTRKRSPTSAPSAKPGQKVAVYNSPTDRESFEGDIGDDDFFDFGEDFNVVDEISG